MSYLVGSLGGGIFGRNRCRTYAGSSVGSATADAVDMAVDLSNASAMAVSAPMGPITPASGILPPGVTIVLPPSLAKPTQTDGSSGPAPTLTTMDAGGKGPVAVEVHADSVSASAPASAAAVPTAAVAAAMMPSKPKGNGLLWLGAAAGAWWLYSKSKKKTV